MIYQEYYGEGFFKDVPLVGGLQGLEDKYGTKWRSGSAFQKSFNRLRVIVKCVGRQIAEGKEKEVVLKEMDELFKEKGCKTLQQFRNALAEGDLFPKRVGSTSRQRPATTA